MRVLRDNYGNSRSVGFVQYHVLEDAMAALKGMNGRQVGLLSLKTYVVCGGFFYTQYVHSHLTPPQKTTDGHQNNLCTSSTAPPG